MLPPHGGDLPPNTRPGDLQSPPVGDPAISPASALQIRMRNLPTSPSPVVGAGLNGIAARAGVRSRGRIRADRRRPWCHQPVGSPPESSCLSDDGPRARRWSFAQAQAESIRASLRLTRCALRVDRVRSAVEDGKGSNNQWVFWLALVSLRSPGPRSRSESIHHQAEARSGGAFRCTGAAVQGAAGAHASAPTFADTSGEAVSKAKEDPVTRTRAQASTSDAVSARQQANWSWRANGSTPETVPRVRLVSRLLASEEPVVSVLAPPGYGKSTLLWQWAERRRAPHRLGLVRQDPRRSGLLVDRGRRGDQPDRTARTAPDPAQSPGRGTPGPAPGGLDRWAHRTDHTGARPAGDHVRPEGAGWSPPWPWPYLRDRNWPGPRGNRFRTPWHGCGSSIASWSWAPLISPCRAARRRSCSARLGSSSPMRRRINWSRRQKVGRRRCTSPLWGSERARRQRPRGSAARTGWSATTCAQRCCAGFLARAWTSSSAPRSSTR